MDRLPDKGRSILKTSLLPIGAVVLLCGLAGFGVWRRKLEFPNISKNIAIRVLIQDDKGSHDLAKIAYISAPESPTGSSYNLWLKSRSSHIYRKIGTWKGGDRQSFATYSSDRGGDLLSDLMGLEVWLAPDTLTGNGGDVPAGDLVAQSSIDKTLHEKVMALICRPCSSNAYLRDYLDQVNVIDHHVHKLLDILQSENRDRAQVQIHAEDAYNAFVGTHNAKDLNADGKVTPFPWTVGLMGNSDNAGTFGRLFRSMDELFNANLPGLRPLQEKRDDLRAHFQKAQQAATHFPESLASFALGEQQSYQALEELHLLGHEFSDLAQIVHHSLLETLILDTGPRAVSQPASTGIKSMAAKLPGGGDLFAQAQEIKGRAEIFASKQGMFFLHVRPASKNFPLNDPFAIQLEVRDGQNQVVEVGADLQLAAIMPEHKHGLNSEPVIVGGDPGFFQVKGVLLHMPGRWDFTVRIRYRGQEDIVGWTVEL